MVGWQRYLSQLQVDWACNDFQDSACNRTGFKGVLMKSPITGYNEATFTKEMRLKRYMVTVPLLAACWLARLILAMVIILVQSWLNEVWSALVLG